MRSYMVVCVLAIAVLHTTGYPTGTGSGNAGSANTALMKTAGAPVDTAATQPSITEDYRATGGPVSPGLKEVDGTLPVYSAQAPVLHVRSSLLLAAVTPTPDQRPCYYLGIVAPGEMDKGILGPYPIATPQYEPQKPGSIEYCHPAPPMAFVPGSAARITVELARP